ncbi:hypothetical protein HK102_003421 [Quaeritorhiza haematococci]|nr:hypothetical protein HK102_003421 [Quaeritorhiza haematococci]
MLEKVQKQLNRERQMQMRSQEEFEEAALQAKEQEAVLRSELEEQKRQLATQATRTEQLEKELQAPQQTAGPKTQEC